MLCWPSWPGSIPLLLNAALPRHPLLLLPPPLLLCAALPCCLLLLMSLPLVPLLLRHAQLLRRLLSSLSRKLPLP